MKASALLIACLAALVVAAPAQATTGVSVRGGGSGTFPAGFGAITGDRLHIEVSARTLASGTAIGTVQVVHQHDAGALVAQLHGTVTCLQVSGTTAWVSGTVTGGKIAEAPGFDPTGQTFAITIQDQGSSDAAGLDLSFFGGPHAVPACEHVPAYLSIDEGSYAVGS